MTRIREVMSRDFKVISPVATLQEAAELMRDYDIGFLPVAENDRLVGMITDRDIAVRGVAAGKNPFGEFIRSVMTPKTYYCYEDQSVEDICDNMAEIKVRRLPVVNREKRLVGIVSLGDVSQACNAAKTGHALQDITHRQHLTRKAA